MDGPNLVRVGQGETFRLRVQGATELFELLEGGAQGDAAVLDVHEDRHDGLGSAGVVDDLTSKEDGVKSGVLEQTVC